MDRRSFLGSAVVPLSLYLGKEELYFIPVDTLPMCHLRVLGNRAVVSQGNSSFEVQTRKRGDQIEILDNLPSTVQVDLASIRN